MVTESRKQDLLNNIAKLEAYHELQNEMGRAAAAFNFRQAEKSAITFCVVKRRCVTGIR